MADAPKYPDFSQPSIMNPQYGPYAAKLLGPLIREMQRQQQFAGAFGVSPRQAIKPTPEETQRMLNVGLAFGGADITKEQREAWEAENQSYRAKERKAGRGIGETLSPGTRVRINQSKSAVKLDPTSKGMENFNAVVITPGTDVLHQYTNWDPLKAEKQSMTSPGKDFVAVQFENAPKGNWFWRHRSELEVLPPHDFKVGDNVIHLPEWGDLADHGVIAEPPKGTIPSPGPEWVWADFTLHPEAKEPPTRDYEDLKGLKHYAGGSWGAWILKSDLTKKGK